LVKPDFHPPDSARVTARMKPSSTHLFGGDIE
jgi:hypothetical protein